MPPAQGPCTHRAHGTGWAWLLGYVLHPTQPSALLGKQVEADGDVPLSFWQRRQAAQPFDAVTLWALAVCPAAGSAQGHSGGPACPSPHSPHRTIPPQWAVHVATMPQTRHMQIRLMGCHSKGSQTGSNHTHGFSPSAGGQEPEVTVAGWVLLRDRSKGLFLGCPLAAEACWPSLFGVPQPTDTAPQCLSSSSHGLLPVSEGPSL